MNYKCKSHRGRSPNNKTDALSIVECNNGILRAFACIIPNKESNTILPIISNQVASGSIIWTDEHRSYSRLSQKGFIHGTVCQKYEFVEKNNGINTHTVEIYHNCIKEIIKKQRGVTTEKREEFLKEFLFFFNNGKNVFEVGINLLKINY
ncbi:hypothetical protein H312_03543 [Anncaliia algerae PRA339]|uniref:ISXO2-like transposase domain-containing protein n=1 Tax=Anncaliia algerae PRA339 TaxID=1288291 RepID=A0A059EVQ6_9MICR|nr:hypothetical protein H312_03543 [Anncaliia algerae PRA339]